MYLEPLFPTSIPRSRRNLNRANYQDIKPWVIKAIAEEDHKPDTTLWRKEPTAEYQRDERLRRVRLLRKHQHTDPLIKIIADRLENCERNQRCCSGACPECGRLLQRWFVRKSKALIRDEIEKLDQQLVAITIIPSRPIIRPGKLHTFAIKKMVRRLKYALDKSDIEIAIVVIDFSFNEEKQGRYKPFWCPHFYLITSITDRDSVSELLKQSFKSDRRIPRPIKISDFDNSARRRSYAFKIHFRRRIGLNKQKIMKNGTTRKCRDTSHDKLRAAERLELFVYLDQIGFAQRFIFRSVKPVIKADRVILQKI